MKLLMSHHNFTLTAFTMLGPSGLGAIATRPLAKSCINPRQESRPMNDLILTEQLAKVNALLTEPCDEEWIAETEQIEGDG
ncbi:MAG: hypothetical protein F6K19_38985 [Cyanothece sp. SIO1E1]|nr:hypothetical protein [Cyanothece sp. SIO1E1]